MLKCLGLDGLHWPDLSQVEWAAWIQVLAAIVGIVLALYIPVRMKRLEDYERIRAAGARVSALKVMRDLFARAMDPSVAIVQPPRHDFHTIIRGCEALIEDPQTDADFLPHIGRAIQVANGMLSHWNARASGPDYRASEAEYLARVCAEFDVEHAATESIVASWRRKHWLALAFH